MKNNHICQGCDIAKKALKEECGVFGVYNRDGGMDAAQTIYYGLYALQHRGQESCGIAVNDDGTIIHHKDLGTVPRTYLTTPCSTICRGRWALAHVLVFDVRREPARECTASRQQITKRVHSR